MKYKALIGALALTFGLATVSHAQATAKDITKKATVTTTTKKHHRSHKKSASMVKAASAVKAPATVKAAVAAPKKDTTKK
ncbi:MAG TPA: hypothetical protein VFC35_06185 [Gemmatimonadaceae bacterium]|nr:hypothetical protein [Gemmatimonadaceae bacterium]